MKKFALLSISFFVVNVFAADKAAMPAAKPEAKPGKTHPVEICDPYKRLPQVPSFKVASTDIKDGEKLPASLMSGIFGVPGGQDASPQLSWSGFPAATKGFAVTVYDPDAPTASGFWHWAVADIPVSVTALASKVGIPGDSLLPKGAFQLRNDAGIARFLGAAPPAGHGRHHYFVVVHALDVPTLGITKDVAPAILGFNLFQHTLARATLVAWAEQN